MAVNDRLLGAAGFALSLALYAYYTAWVIVAPFVDPQITWFHSLFPARWWAFALPTAALVLGLAIIATFIGLVSLRGR